MPTLLQASVQRTPHDLARILRNVNQLPENEELLIDSVARAVGSFLSGAMRLPSVGPLSSGYSLARRHPVHLDERPHRGIDIKAPAGSRIDAAAAGRVLKVGRVAGYGLLVELDHGAGIVTRYGHCSEVVVREDQLINQGQLIARVGSSGLSTGPHLHFEIRVNGVPVDPLRYIRASTEH